MTGDTVTVEVGRDDALALLDALGEREQGERWSARVFCSVADALGEPVPDPTRREAGQ